MKSVFKHIFVACVLIVTGLQAEQARVPVKQPQLPFTVNIKPIGIPPFNKLYTVPVEIRITNNTECEITLDGSLMKESLFGKVPYWQRFGFFTAISLLMILCLYLVWPIRITDVWIVPAVFMIKSDFHGPITLKARETVITRGYMRPDDLCKFQTEYAEAFC